MPADWCLPIVTRIEANLVIVMFWGFFLPDVENKQVNHREGWAYRVHTVVAGVISLPCEKQETRAWRWQQEDQTEGENKPGFDRKSNRTRWDEDLKVHDSTREWSLGAKAMRFRGYGDSKDTCNIVSGSRSKRCVSKEFPQVYDTIHHPTEPASPI